MITFSNTDGIVDQSDRSFWVEQLEATHFGDANLDGLVDFADFLKLSSEFGQLGGWADGDFDGNGDVQFADFLLLSANFGKSAEALAPVPEPNPLNSIWLSVIVLVTYRRWRFKV